MESLTNDAIDQPNEYPVDEETIDRVGELVSLLADEDAYAVNVDVAANGGTPTAHLSLRLRE